MTPQQWYECFQDPSYIAPITKHFRRHLKQDCPRRDRLGLFRIRQISRKAEANLNTAFTYCESPIEKAFAFQLQAAAFALGQYGFTIIPPSTTGSDVEERINWSSDLSKKVLCWRERKQFIRSERDSEWPQSEPEHENIRYCPTDNNHSIHVIIQPELRLNGRLVRPDFAIFVPTNSKCRMFVECDGYEYHTDKETFTKDRKRDRALSRLGWDVRRFSGSEIFGSCGRCTRNFCGYELIEELIERHHCGRNWRRNWERSAQKRMAVQELRIGRIPKWSECLEVVRNG